MSKDYFPLNLANKK